MAKMGAKKADLAPLDIKEFMALTPGERNRLYEVQKLVTEALDKDTPSVVAVTKLERAEDILREVTRAQWWRMV